MCFLYRQSISIVYESKFKYIYRYFIKIDRCFCGILQSLPLRKCGLKFTYIIEKFYPLSSLPLRKCGLKLGGKWLPYVSGFVTSLAEVWIEIVSSVPSHPGSSASLPLRKCGLKFSIVLTFNSAQTSLPLRKCGLKSMKLIAFPVILLSLPLRKCGLK